MNESRLLLAGPEQTEKLGLAIGACARAGDVIYLDGDLGAGKTTLTKSIASAIGIPPEAVTSPTFTLVHEYRGGKLPIYHFDLYRLSSGGELENIGFDDYLSSEDGLVIVEWAVNAIDRLPDDALSIVLSADQQNIEHRTATITAAGPRSSEIRDYIMRLFSC
jgi:tRNA threonylcarbamoyladenosine biosynthesis protein TsaE